MAKCPTEPERTSPQRWRSVRPSRSGLRPSDGEVSDRAGADFDDSGRYAAAGRRRQEFGSRPCQAQDRSKAFSGLPPSGDGRPLRRVHDDPDPPLLPPGHGSAIVTPPRISVSPPGGFLRPKTGADGPDEGEKRLDELRKKPGEDAGREKRQRAVVPA